MQEVFENIIEKLGRKRAYYNAKFESTQNLHEKDEATTRFEDFNEAIEIVKQAAEECKHGHFGCNTNGQHEKCSTCCDYDCKNRNREWFGLKDDNNGWIPCSERLPTTEEYQSGNGRFLVTDGNRTYEAEFDIYESHTFGRSQMSADWFVTDKCVTHWQNEPLPPKPYQPKGE